MAFTEVQDLGCDTAISLGGRDKKTGKPNPTTLTGYFLGTREIASKFSASGKAKMHVFQTPKGNVGVFGKTDLDRKMSEVQAGVMVRVTQNGSVPTNKGNDMLKFKVEVDADNSIVVSPPSTEGGYEESAADPDGYGVDPYAAEEDLPVETTPPPAARPAPRAATPEQRAKAAQALLASRK